MEKFVRGEVVVIPFPFSDLSNSKRRPALITSNLKGDDVILCQITSEPRRDRYSIKLKKKDFARGGLNLTSRISPNRLFTADRSIILYSVGKLKNSKMGEVTKKLKEIFGL